MSGSIVEVLNQSHMPLIESFSCIEEDSVFSGLKNKSVKKIRTHSEKINQFFSREALADQTIGMNTPMYFWMKKEV
jgi:hypothetical protein